MVNNLNIILPFLKFESEDDFYYLQILQRKKENPQLGSNSRVIKNYYIKSEKNLLDRWDEIVQLCEIFNARASIRLNKRSFRKVGMKTMVNLANTLMNEEYKFLNKSYDRACGLGHNDKNKKWILDIDKDFLEQKSKLVSFDILEDIKKVINEQSLPEGNKILEIIPSKTGFHFITKAFNPILLHSSDNYPEIEIHKDNPTNLYIP